MLTYAGGAAVDLFVQPKGRVAQVFDYADRYTCVQLLGLKLLVYEAFSY